MKIVLEWPEYFVRRVELFAAERSLSFEEAAEALTIHGLNWANGMDRESYGDIGPVVASIVNARVRKGTE